MRRLFLLIGLLFALSATGTDFPAKPVRIVVPFPPGNLTDRLARLVGERLHEPLGQPVIVENRPGAHGNTGALEVARAAPDGHTLFMGYVGTHAVNPSLYPDLPYHPVKDFAPVTLVASVPNMLVVRPGLPARDVRELVALARREPGKLTFASIGTGTSTHMAAEQLKSAAGIDIVHVPYKGIGPAMLDVIAGRVDMMFGTVASAHPHARAGKLRALGVTTPARVPSAPEVPTFAEQGIAGFDQGAWFALYAPAGTPARIVDRLQQEISRILNRTDVAASLAAQGITPVGGSPAELAQFQREEAARWARIVRAARIKPD
jgi:tripartite-type tricarboxylate transporter receptor subunit TctC